MAPRAAQRQYASMIAESPVRHAIFNKPFSSLRRKTENLLDNITGGSLQIEMEKEQRLENEKRRELTCRFCRMIFANDQGLSKHYDLFPKHLQEERQSQKRPQHQRSSSTASSNLLNTFSSSPMINPAPTLSRFETSPLENRHPKSSTAFIENTNKSNTSIPLENQNQIHQQHSRAKSQPELQKKDFIPSSRPLPTPPKTISASVSQNTSPQINSNSVFPTYTGHSTASPISQSSPIQSQQTSPPLTSSHSFANSRLASDFYLPSESWTSFHPSSNGGGGAMELNNSSSPYGVANSMAFANRNPQQGSQSPNNFIQSQPPHAAAMLPSFDFETQFTRIPREGIPEPPKARPVNTILNEFDPIGDRNRQAGAESAARIASKYEYQSQPSPSNQRDDRFLPHRGVSESSGLSIKPTTQINTEMPNTFGGVVRAIVATGASGPSSPAVSPSQSAYPFENARTASAYSPLSGGEEDVDIKVESRSRSPSGSGRQWGSLMDSLPGSPAQEKKIKAAAFKQPRKPVKTGLTSFSSAEPERIESPSDSGRDSPVVGRPRRNTNPFLNRDFMKNLPNPLKTPPLTPSSPWGNGGGLASPGNPFQQLADDDVDDQVEFFDAPNGPKTPIDETMRSSSSNNNKDLNSAPMALPEPVKSMPGAL